MSHLYDEMVSLPMGFYASKYNEIRRQRIVILYCCMRKWGPFKNLTEKIQEECVRKIERSCYNNACDESDKNNEPKNWNNENFISLYSITCFKVQQNLEWSKDDPGSEYLIESITKGEYEIDNIGYKNEKKLRPLKSKEIEEDIEKRKQQKVTKKISAQHRCFKCGNSCTTEREVQLRSLDEGSTLFIKCEFENCSNEWSIST